MSAPQTPPVLPIYQEESIINSEQIASAWEVAASALGWKYSDAFGGWIADHHLDPETGWHPSDMAAEDACFIDGVESEADAQALVRKAESEFLLSARAAIAKAVAA